MLAVVLLIGLLIGLLLGRLLFKRGRPATGTALAVMPHGSNPAAVQRAGAGSGLQVLAADLTGAPVLTGTYGPRPAALGAGTTLASASPIAAEATRLGLLRGAVGDDVYRMHLRSPLGKGRKLMDAGNGRHYGDVLGEGGIVEKGQLETISFTDVVSPQLLWAVAAFAVGQHFQAVIASQLATIDAKLSTLMAKAAAKDIASLEAARRELGLAAARLLDGVSPGEVATGLSAQVQAIGTAWQQSLDWLSQMEAALASTRPTAGNSELEKRLPQLFKKDLKGEFFVDARLFLTALVANAQLQLFRAEEMALRGGDQAHGNFADFLRRQADECSAAYGRFLRLVAGVARLRPRQDGFMGHGGGHYRAVTVIHEMLALEDQLRELRLPLVHGGDELYEVILSRAGNGAVMVELPGVEPRTEIPQTAG
jgi:hypothetical protein